MFERQWALTLLAQVLLRLEAEMVAGGKREVFENIKGFLTGEDASETVAEIATRFGVTEGALKMTIHRMRRRYRKLLKEEIAQTVTGPEEVEDEIRHLFKVLS